LQRVYQIDILKLAVDSRLTRRRAGQYQATLTHREFMGAARLAAGGSLRRWRDLAY